MSSRQDAIPQTKASSAYWMSAGYGVSARLHLQHYLLFNEIREPLPPQVNWQDKPLRIADLACGNGIWMIDLLNRPNLPQHEFIGLDLNPSLFPPQEWLSPQITLREFNALKPDDIPTDLQGTFDVVHARLLCTIFNNGDPSLFLQTVSKLLKPGGWLRWEEDTLASCSAVAAPGRSSVAATKMAAIIEGWFSARAIRDHVFEDWPNKYDLSIIKKSAFETPNHLLKPATECKLMVLPGHAKSYPTAAELKESGKEGMSREEYELLIEETVQECIKGVALKLGSYFVVDAQKSQV